MVLSGMSLRELKAVARMELSTGSRLTKRDELIRAITAIREQRYKIMSERYPGITRQEIDAGFVAYNALPHVEELSAQQVEKDKKYRWYENALTF